MEFYLPEDFPARRVYFTFHVEGDSGGGVTYTADTTVELFVGRDVLLVDDDSGSGTYGNYESYYIQAFDSLRVVYDVWDKQAKGDYASSLSDYKVLVWYTGDHREDVFSQEDIDSLTSFLDDGGSLFLTSQSAVEALSASGETSDSIFLADYLHVGYDGTSSKLLIMGEAGDEVGDTLWIKPWDLSGANNQTSKDELVPDSEADTVLVYADGPGWIPTNFVAGSKFGNDYFRVVLFGFGFEALARGEFFGKLLSQPHFVMQRVLDWLKARPTINVIYPDGGEAWFVDQSYDILWECISFEDSVKIEYSTNNGDDWSTIVDTTTNDGVYSWTVPDTPSESCLIRISDVDNGIPFDVSDDCFSIMNYIPGDPNGDGLVNVADVVYLTTYLFLDGPPPQPLSAGDPNGDCVVNVADAVYLVTYLFADGPPPQPGCAE